MLLVSPASPRTQNEEEIKRRSKLGKLCRKHSVYLPRMRALTFLIEKTKKLRIMIRNTVFYAKECDNYLFNSLIKIKVR